MFNVEAKRLPDARACEPSAVQQSAVEFVGVAKAFGAHTVLENLHLDVAVGETLALIGPSGSGKTTVLRLAMGLESADEGDVRILGETLTISGALGWRERRSAHRSRDAVRRKCGMVFQQFNLFPHKTVLENLILAPQRVRSVPRATAVERAETLLDLVGLKEKSVEYPHRLSGGQQQRIAIARALMLEPQVLLLDEITSALDPELVGEVLDLVRRLSFEMNMAILLVTHQMRFARAVADRVAMFSEGNIVECGPPEQIFEAPTHDRTRSFLRSVMGAE